jgi:tetratricopeptide (TPR) repeat protein
VSELVAQFAALLAQTDVTAGGSIDLLLAQLEPAAADLLRKCAIPHQFNDDTLRVLTPSLTPEGAAERFEQFSRLSAVIATPDGLALHDRVRQHLFSVWLGAAEYGREFREVSGRLVASITEQLRVEPLESEKDTLRRRRIFHSLAVNQNDGIAEFEQEFENYREHMRFTSCINLLRMVEEYAPVLSQENQAHVSFREGKLAFDRADLGEAERLYSIARDIPHSDTMLRMKAWFGLGNTYDTRRDWKKAVEAFTRALQLAELKPETRSFRCRILRSLGSVQRDTGNLDAAEHLLKQSLELAQEANDARGIAISRNALGALYIQTEEPGRAIEYLKSSVDQLPNDDFQRARVYNNLGLAYRKLCKYADSLRWYDRSLELKVMGGDTLGQARTWNNIVVLHGEQGAAEKAIEAATRAAELFTSVFAWFDAGNAWLTAARLHEERLEYADANTALLTAIDAYTRAYAVDDVQRVKDEFEARRKMKRSEFFHTLVIIGGVVFTLFILMMFLGQMFQSKP